MDWFLATWMTFMATVLPHTFGQEYGSGSPQVMIQPPVAAAANSICMMDFNGSGCLDTDGDTCTASGSADPDCTVSPCPLAGAKSGHNDTSTDIIEDVNCFAGRTDLLTMDALWRFDAESDPGFESHFGFANATDDFASRMQFGTNVGAPEVNAQCASGASGTAFSVTVATTYKIRQVYTSSDDLLVLSVCPAASCDWGETDTGTTSCDGGGSGGDIVGWIHKRTGNDSFLDSIGICVGTISVGTKCGEED